MSEMGSGGLEGYSWCPLTGGKIHSQSIVILNDHFYPMVSVYIKKGVTEWFDE